MAGHHQIWMLDIETGKIGVYAGNGRENILDGPLAAADFAQPSGLATDGKNLYVADTEVSGVRADHLAGHEQPPVEPSSARACSSSATSTATAPRSGCSTPGRRLRRRQALRRRHVQQQDQGLRPEDPHRQDLRRRRHSRCERRPAQFNEPGGLSVAGNKLYVADTNNHEIRVVDLKTGDVRTLKLEGLNPPQAEPKVAAAGAE